MPRYIPAANQAARGIAEAHDGVPVSSVTEVLLDVPTTAHISGGCAMGATPEEGVIDSRNRVHGYPGLYVVMADDRWQLASIQASPLPLWRNGHEFIPEKDAEVDESI